MSPARPMLALALGLTAALAACAQRQPSLYAWGEFPRWQYEAMAGDSPDLQARLLAMAEWQRTAAAEGRALPPGFRAHFGMLRLAAQDPAQARADWLAEKAAFPESAAFMDMLLAKLDATARPPAAGGAP